MKQYIDPEFAVDSTNQLTPEEQTAEAQRTGIPLGVIIISRFFNTMLGKITNYLRMQSTEMLNVLNTANITPDANNNAQLSEAILKLIAANSTGLAIGDIIPNAGTTPIPGRQFCDGTVIDNCDVVYPKLYAFVIASTSFKSMAEYTSQVNSYGQCGFFGVNGTSVRVPLITRPISGVGTVISDTGKALLDTMRPITGACGTFGGESRGDLPDTGALWHETGVNKNRGSDATGSGIKSVNIDSSRLGARYSGSETRGKQVLYPYSVIVELGGASGSGGGGGSVLSVNGKIGLVVINKVDIGLPNVDNTSDLDKPISTATQEALDLKVDKVAGKGLSTDDFIDAPNNTNIYAKKGGLWTIIDAFINGISLLGKDNTCDDLGLQCKLEAGNNTTLTQTTTTVNKLLMKFTSASGIQDISDDPVTFNIIGTPIYGPALYTNSTNQSLTFQNYDSRITFASGVSKLNAIKTISFRCSRTGGQYTRGIIFSNSNGVDQIRTTGFTAGTGTIGGDWGTSLPYDGTPYDLAFSKQEGTELWVLKDGVKIAIITVPSDFVFDLSTTNYACIHDNITAGTESVSGIVCSTESLGEYTPTQDYPVKASSIIKEAIACKNYFGELYTADNTNAQTIPSGTDYTKVTSPNTAGEYRGVTLDAANNKMILPSTGYYKVSVTASSKLGSAGVTLKSALFLNGIKVPNCQAIRKINNANDESTVSFGGIVKVDTANSEIDIRVSQSSGSDVSLTTVFCNLNVTYEGDLTL